MIFCKYCGRQLADGEQCTCPEALNAAAAANSQILSAGTDRSNIPPEQQNPYRKMLGEYDRQNLPVQQQAGYPQFPPQGYPNANGFQQADAAAVSAQPAQKKKTGIIIAAAAVLLALIGFLVWFFALRDTVPDYEKPIKSMFDSINQRDYKAGKDALLTTHYFEWWTDYKFDGDNAECRSYYKELCADYSESMVEYFDEAADELDTKSSKIQYSYSVVSKEKLDRDELENLEDRFYKFYDTGDLKEGYRLKVKITFTAGKESKTSKGYISVVNVRKDGWKLVPESADDFDFGEYDADDMIDVILDA